MKKKLPVPILVVALAFMLACYSAAPDTETARQVTDNVGRTVSLPEDIESISCVCPFSGAIIVMLGYGDELTTGCNNMTRSALLNEFSPGIADLTVVKNSGSVNAEAILEYGADVIFVNQGTYDDADQRAKLDAIGIPYVVVGY